ncbi:MAG TPA: hypothetical protein VG943_13870 [Caulobacterales bacterium]|nr:hypothetical protein [Caulobacterales bacterium]
MQASADGFVWEVAPFRPGDPPAPTRAEVERALTQVSSVTTLQREYLEAHAAFRMCDYRRAMERLEVARERAEEMAVSP